MDLPIDTMHLKDPLFLFRSEGSALTLPLFHSVRIITLCHCSSTMTTDNFLVLLMALNGHSFVPCTHGVLEGTVVVGLTSGFANMHTFRNSNYRRL